MTLTIIAAGFMGGLLGVLAASVAHLWIKCLPNTAQLVLTPAPVPLLHQAGAFR